MPVTEQALSEMPPLPEPDEWDASPPTMHLSDDAVRAYASQAVLAERERCARLAETAPLQCNGVSPTTIAKGIAAAIRARK